MNTALLIIVVAVAVADVALGITVLQRNNRSFTNRSFAATSAAMALWVVANFLSDQLAASLPRLIFLNRLTVAAGIVSGMLLFAFALSYPHRRAQISRSWWLAFIMGGTLALLSMTTPLLVAEVIRESWGTNIVLGPLYVLVVIWGVVCCVALTVNVVRRYRVASPRERVQFRYLYLGIACFVSAALLITGVLPLVLGNNQLARFMPFAALLFLVPTAYAMLRHRLLDIGWPAVRAAAFTLLLACIAAAMVVLAGLWIDDFLTPLGVDSRAGFFVVGVLALLCFQPVRETIEQTSDRFLRQRTYDPDLLLAQIGEAISTTLDPDAVSSIVAETLAREMKLGFAAVAYLREGRPTIVSAGPELPGTDLRELLALPSDRRTIVADELESGDPDERLLARYDARVVMPLLHDDNLLGAIALGYKKSGRIFTARDLRFLEILATETSVSLRNAALFDELNQRVRELGALNQLAGSIGTDIEPDAMLQRALEQAVAVTGAEAGSIMLLDETGLSLGIAVAIGLDDQIVASTHIQVGEGISGRVASTRKPLVLMDAVDELLEGVTPRAEITSAMAVPVVFKDELIGVINLSRKESLYAFTAENLDVVTSFAGQLAVAVKNARLFSDLEDTFLGTISSLAAAVDAKDPYTFGHSTEVTEYTDAIGCEMGLSANDRQILHIAATLHDIGKIGIDGAILRKPGALDDEERAAIQRHPSIAADILAPLDFAKEAVPFILFHHERFAGGGYPSGISGSAIPLGARIISVADSFNAMISDRPYRAGLPIDTAIRELRDNSGSQFDPEVVAAFTKILAAREVARPELRVVPSAQIHKPSAQSHAG